MYGIIACSGCGRKRIIDMSVKESKCPYCGRISETERMKVIFKDESQKKVRDALSSLSGYAEDERPIDSGIDPMSSLAYSVEHTSDTSMKMELIAEGLTKIKGTFTEEDVDEIVPGKGEKYVRAMLGACIIYEVGNGRYSV